ncbi:MAG: hypothetical protein ACU0BS_11800 [Hasllibacter sp.]
MDGLIFHYSGRDAAIYRASRQVPRIAPPERPAGSHRHQAVVRLTLAPGADPGELIAALRAHPQVRCCGFGVEGGVTARLSAPAPDALGRLIGELREDMPGVAAVAPMPAFGCRHGRDAGRR